MQSTIQQPVRSHAQFGEMGVKLEDDEELKVGDIKELMLDIDNGKVCYAVLSFGGFLSLGEKLFAIPWSALTVDMENQHLIMDADEERLKNAPGFDADNWPNMADSTWERSVHDYYGTTS